MTTQRRDILKYTLAAAAASALPAAHAQAPSGASAGAAATGIDPRDRVFITNEDSNTLVVIDPKTNTVESTINLTSFDEDPRPPFRYVTAGVAPTHAAMIHKPLYHGCIDAHGAVPSPDGRLLATSGRGSSNIYLIDAEQRRVIGNTPNPASGPTTNPERLSSGLLLGREPHEPTFTRNGRELWVTLRGEDRIAIVGVDRAVRQLKGADSPGSSAVRQYLPTLSGPAQVWFNREGTLAFVASQKVSKIDVFRVNPGADGHSQPQRLTTLDISAQDKPGFTPFMKTTPDGAEVWFSHKLADAVSCRSTQGGFDLIDTEYFSLKKIVPTGNLKGIDTKKIKNADKITPLFTTGTVAGKAVGDQGTAPKKVIYLEGEKSKKFATAPTQFMSLIPTVYNADTLGIRPDLIKRPIESWAELLNPEFKGKAAILNIPSIGIMDAAMVVEAKGIHKYKDKGNMTKTEIDLTIKTLIEAKKAGQFRALWKDFNESVNLMASGEVVIQSMWSPAVTAVRTKGIACNFQPLKEGYRAWAAGFGLPTTLSGRKLDGAYEFINWFLDGWAGAYLNRQGYYSAVLDTAKAKMEGYEWAYWMEGKPASQDIKSPNGDVLAKAGAVRDGGSYEARMGGIACWNAVMDENEYMVRKWNEFVAA